MLPLMTTSDLVSVFKSEIQYCPASSKSLLITFKINPPWCHTIIPVTTDGGTFQEEWNGCVWEFINSDVFLRNATFEIKDVSEYVEPEDPYKYRFVLSGAGETGGEAEHTLTV